MIKGCGVFNLQERQLKQDSIAVFKYQKDCHSEQRMNSFSIASGVRTRINKVKITKEEVQTRH